MEAPIPIRPLRLAKAALLTAALSATFALTNNAWGSERPSAELSNSESSGKENRAIEPGSRPELSEGRLLTAREGRALAAVAFDPPIMGENPDCSHLVHQILNDAGLTYPYATSFEIYAGIPQFRRVRHAQPGDLIVWRGHVGLVVDPKQATFFSSTNSGVHTDQYSSDYWRHRGYHRFYRYLVTHTTQLAARRLTEGHTGKPNHHLETTASSKASRTPQTLYADPSSKAAPDADSSKAAPASESRPVEASRTETSADASSISSANRDLSETISFDSIPIHSAKGRPIRQDLEQAIEELTNASSAALDTEKEAARDAASAASIPVVFVRSWKIEKIKINEDEGWVELRVEINDTSETSDGGDGEQNPDAEQNRESRGKTAWKSAAKKSHVEKLRCALRRDQSGWVLLPPPDRLYVIAQR